MPEKLPDLKRYLFRAWMAYLLTVPVVFLLLFLLRPEAESPAAEYAILSLMSGILPGGWYVAGCWIRKQISDGVVRPSITTIMDRMLYGMFLFVGPMLYIPAMIVGLIRLYRLSRTAA